MSPGEHTGFRLQRFEVYNWGTFDGRVWALEPGGDNALLTGDIGSGKSTLVDGLVTLLVPPQKLAYNKAAGAESRERTLRSYVLGQYKSERGDAGARPVCLRDGKSYTVLLGHFYNAGYSQHVTLAQVLWMRDSENQPARMYIVADRRLSIAEDFAGFGADMNVLRRRMKGLTRDVHDTFPPYAAAFRRRFGIESEQALDLFHQTVSMKAVGNLTDFVREHMLQPFQVEARLTALVGHFDDLHRAHESVLKARRQLSHLEPLVRDCERHSALVTELEALRACREGLRPWFAEKKAGLLSSLLEGLEAESQRVRLDVEQLGEQRRLQGLERDRLKVDIAANGGARLDALRVELLRLRAEKSEREQKARRYATLASEVGLAEAVEVDQFVSNARAIEALHAEAAQGQSQRQTTLADAGVELRSLRAQHAEVRTELEALQRRPSNIPSRMLALRDRMCSELGVPQEALPFVGELLQVREEEQAWEGAIERVLSSFGVSLLVTDAHYDRVASWVERSRLDGRLVYYRVVDDAAARAPSTGPQSLVRKLRIKPDSECHRWLSVELARRFNLVCCEDLVQFRREPLALTRSGQVKRGGERHEKDDRFSLEDRSRFVLGWTNESKRMALEAKLRSLEARGKVSAARCAELQAELRSLQARGEALKQLALHESFRELDWRSLDAESQEREVRLRELESASNVLQTLRQQLEALELALARTEHRAREMEKKLARLEERTETSRALLAASLRAREEAPEAVRARYPVIEALCSEVAGEAPTSAERWDERERRVRELIQTRLEGEGRKLERLRDGIIRAMQSYRAEFPLETQELDASLDAVDGYVAALRSLREDDLPRFESRFKSLLNENAIREVANFQTQLHRERHDILERIRTINASLKGIDYGPGRFILLEATPCADADVREFQQDLRACTEGALSGGEDAAYSEQKFAAVQRIIERFRGRAQCAEADARWTRRVTDVRNWFTFSVSERYRSDGSEHEHYTDSGGKSGGQKEKLAYTVLAASLAYQFGLEFGEQRSRAFRFVVIDEAFGRGSDDSAVFGLDLFRRLNLQLLIVTPLQKIRVIEPHVSSVGFVHNVEGKSSKVRHLSIEEYRSERSARSA